MTELSQQEVFDIWSRCVRPKIQVTYKVTANRIYFSENGRTPALPVQGPVFPVQGQIPGMVISSVRRRVGIQVDGRFTQESNQGQVRVSPPAPVLEPPRTQATPSVRTPHQEANRRNKMNSKKEKRYTIFFLAQLINKVAEVEHLNLNIVVAFSHKSNWGRNIPLPFEMRVNYSGPNENITKIAKEVETRQRTITNVPQRISFLCNMLYKIAENIGIELTLSSHPGVTPKDKSTSSRKLLKCVWKNFQYDEKDILLGGKELYERQIENHPELNLPYD